MTDQKTGSSGGKKHDDGIAVARDSSIPIDVVVDVIKNLCLAYSTIHLYSYDHPITETQMKQAWDHLCGVIAEHGKITLSMADGKLFFEGIPLEEKNSTVARLSEHFEQLQVTSLTFMPELNETEFHRFFEVFVKEPAEINNAGGLEKVFESKEITNIRLNSAVYRLIHEDEKVVASDSVVTERHRQVGRRRSRGGKDKVADEIVRYFAAELLEQSKDSNKLINAMKNDPSGLAEKVSRLISSADSDLEKVEFDEVMAALTKSIDSTAQLIAATEDGSDNPAEVDKMEKALHSLEGEMQRRAKRIASSGATKFLHRMTDLIAAYSDSARAESAVRDFVEEEQTHKAAEKMLREISPDAEASHRLMETIRDAVTKHDWDPLQLADKIEALMKGEKRRSQRRDTEAKQMSRRRRKRLAATLRRRLPRRMLVSLLMHSLHADHRAGGHMVQQRLHEVEAELHEQQQALEKQQAELAEKERLVREEKQEIDKLKNDRMRLGTDYLALQKEMSKSKHELETELEEAREELKTKQEEFEERLNDEVGTVMGMLDESEDVRLRLEHLVEKLETGVVIVDREGRVVTSMNADDFPYLQTAAIPPADLVRALQNYDGQSVLTYENIQVFGVVRDEDGFLSGFMFLPEHEMGDNERPRTSAADVLASLEDEDEEEETLDDLLAHRETPSAVLKRIEKDKAEKTPADAAKSLSEQQQKSLEELLNTSPVPSSRKEPSPAKAVPPSQRSKTARDNAGRPEQADTTPQEPDKPPPPKPASKEASDPTTRETTILKKRKPS